MTFKETATFTGDFFVFQIESQVANDSLMAQWYLQKRNKSSSVSKCSSISIVHENGDSSVGVTIFQSQHDMKNCSWTSNHVSGKLTKMETGSQSYNATV